jgi:hypothetical protein
MTNKEILDFEYSLDGETMTIRLYLYSLLSTLWNEGEGFSSKRPFGNSYWESPMYKGLADSGGAEGAEWVEDEDFVGGGYWEYPAKFIAVADKLIAKLIKEVFGV